MYHRILLAVDLTHDSRRISERARELATALGSELEILHVVEPIPEVAPIPPEPVVPIVVRATAEMIENAQERLGVLAQELGVPDTRWRVVEGNTRSEIIRLAIERAADLIVIGNHERHGLAFFIKPTEDFVVHRAPCDVLAIRLSDPSDAKSAKK